MASEISNREVKLPYPHNCMDDNLNGVCDVCGFDEDDYATPSEQADMDNRLDDYSNAY
jgi:hypothetical protein